MKAKKSLLARWEKLKEKDSKVRIRDAASQLGVTEVELLAISKGVIRLQPSFQEILLRVPELGRVMALTRNDDVVHERKGKYLNADLKNAHVGLFVGADIDLRIFWHGWAHAYAVTSMARGQERKSLQFFSAEGCAVHKIYLLEESNMEAYQSIVNDFTHEEQNERPEVKPKSETSPEKSDSEIDVESFQKGWVELKDTHDFFGLVKRHGLSRTQALRLAPEGDYAVPVDPSALRKTLNLVAERECPIMVFVGNKGMIQIHTGPIKKLFDYEEWFNVMDPDFNLHLREKAIASCWVVRKPTEDGMVTALECFDDKGTQIVQLFGKRKPGIPELEEWRDLVAEVQKEKATA